jgi:ribosomal-protein-alanine N-acetyltransferase
MSAIEVVSAGPGDRAAILRIVRAAFDGEAWSEQAVSEELAREHNVTLIARREGVEVGFLIGWCVEDEAELLLLGVLPNARRVGRGRRLVESFERGAVRSGVRRVHLEVREHNHGAQAFYRSVGYAASGRRKAYYRDTGEDAITMAHAVR